MKLFIDTWGWIVLYNRREPRHEEIKNFYRKFRRKRGIAYTTDYILDETFTLIFRKLPFEIARKSIDQTSKAIEAGYLKMVWVSPRYFDESKSLRLRYRDKPKISFTDLTSMVVMNDLKLNRILTDDDHFLHVGMDIQIVP